MRVGILREIKEGEYRAAGVPAGVAALRRAGHTVLVESGAGTGSNISDAQYRQAGARILRSAASVFDQADLILKVKEPLSSEYRRVRPGQILFTFFHFAANRSLVQAMLKSRAVCIAYETVEDNAGRLPILVPMSEIAGRMSVQEGAKYLEKPMRGKGILLGGIPGVAPAEILILGGGVVGANAARVAAGFGGEVTILDNDLDRLRHLENIMPKNVRFLMSLQENIDHRLRTADLVICAALRRGGRAPVLISRKVLKRMKPGSVIVDVAIDQGGCAATSRPTTHAAPIFVRDGIVHYCVSNIPGAVPITSTYGLTNATLPYVLEIAGRGLRGALAAHPALSRGVNLAGGRVTSLPVAEALGLTSTPLSEALA
ncbi:MAG: alanine dehydrogenase [Candidatus Omnitrophica bacterium CG11_big_fil_rev_8_21_14_0_20_64_10]|nr:MAG: alanine dehydrogenase [Candidatus Omnitrophica bacterium CG11_big_fil_rev_8_21_14_0_20_64_10]